MTDSLDAFVVPLIVLAVGILLLKVVGLSLRKSLASRDSDLKQKFFAGQSYGFPLSISGCAIRCLTS